MHVINITTLANLLTLFKIMFGCYVEGFVACGTFTYIPGSCQVMNIFCFEGCILLCLITTISKAPSIATECFLFLFHSPLHVSAPTGHPQVEYTLIIS
jgi:hypothetical protein